MQVRNQCNQSFGDIYKLPPLKNLPKNVIASMKVLCTEIHDFGNAVYCSTVHNDNTFCMKRLLQLSGVENYTHLKIKSPMTVGDLLKFTA